MKERDQRIK